MADYRTIRDYYDAFATKTRSVFNTRSRTEHSRKREALSHAFSTKSVRALEVHIRDNISRLVDRWYHLCDHESQDQDGYITMNALNWFSYLAFDIIGDLAFGAPFGMVSNENDFAIVKTNSRLSSSKAQPRYADVVGILHRQNHMSATVGCFPPLKLIARYFPDKFFSRGKQAFDQLERVAILRVNGRMLCNMTQMSLRTDLLARLIDVHGNGHDELGTAEIHAESLTILAAGGGTTSSSLTALLYWVLVTPGVSQRLRESLDGAIPPRVTVPSYDDLKGVS